MGLGVGLGVGDGVGLGVGDGVGLGVGDGVGLGVGDGVGLGVGDGVGLGVGVGVGALFVTSSRTNGVPGAIETLCSGVENFTMPPLVAALVSTRPVCVPAS